MFSMNFPCVFYLLRKFASREPIINAIGNVTGSSSGYLTSASDSVRDKIKALKQKSEAFYRFAEQILNLLEVAERIDQEVADAIAAGRDYFLDHHESLRIDDWKAKLLGLYVELKNSIPLLGEIADILGGLEANFESLKDSIKHWYECEGGKYIVDILKAYAEYDVAVAFLGLSVLALSLPVAAVFAACGIIAAGIGIVNAATNVATSYRALYEAVSGDPAWAMIYGKQDTLSDVLRQTNFGYGILNDASNIGAGVIDITEITCLIVGSVEMGLGITKLFKGEAFKLLKNKGVLNLSDLKSSFKNGILDLKSSIKQGYKDFKSSLKGAENVEDAAKDANSVIKTSSETGTVWDNITATQNNYPNTKIPRSFEVEVNGQKMWVHGNATEHMYEDVYKGISTGNGTAYTNPNLYSQELMNDFYGSLEQATSTGITYGEKITSGNWEFIFAAPRQEGQLPVIKHAMFKGWH